MDLGQIIIVGCCAIIVALGGLSAPLFLTWWLRRNSKQALPPTNEQLPLRFGDEDSTPPDPEEDPPPDPDDEPYLDVYLNGMLLLPGEDFTVDPEGEGISFPQRLRREDVIQFHTRTSRRVVTIEEDMEPGSSVRMTPERLSSPVRLEEFEEGTPVQRQPRYSPDAIAEALSEIAVKGEPPGDDWVCINPADINLKGGDPIEYEGRNYWVVDVKQDFNPGGHYTYAKLEPMLVPRSRYDRLGSDDDPW